MKNNKHNIDMVWDKEGKKEVAKASRRIRKEFKDRGEEPPTRQEMEAFRTGFMEGYVRCFQILMDNRLEGE